MPSFQSVILVIRKNIKSDLCRTISLCIVALIALTAGMSVGYFVVLWIEWGAILGGLALAGSVFMFLPTGKLLQEFRVLLFVVGFALAGAGLSDFINFPEAGSDVIPGMLIGLTCGLIFSKIILKSGFSLAKARISALFNRYGILISVLLATFGVTFIELAEYFQVYGLSVKSGEAITSIAAVFLQLVHLKVNGPRMMRSAVWITFVFMLIFLLWALVNILLTTEMSDEFSIGFFLIIFVGITLLARRWVRINSSAHVTTYCTFNTMMLQMGGMILLVMALLPLMFFYLQAFINLQFNVSPTQVAANNIIIFRLSDESFIKLMMRDVYYWKPKSEIPYAKDDTPQTFVKKLRSDRWSHASKVADNEDWDAGIGTGRGIMLVKQLGKYIATYVNHNSPAAKAGYVRGDQFLMRDTDAVSGKGIQWLALKPSGETVPVVIPPERFKNDTVIHKIIQQDGKNIGYLWLLDFNNAATPLIQDAFKAFKLQGIEELVLDLRYNGGGHNDEALADLIAGASYEGKVYSRWKFSDKYRDEDSSIVFHRQPNSIPLKRVFVLMTHQTCSASELIINGLRPYMPIITIGEKSCGKPFFMRPITYAGYVYDPVTGRVLNSDGGADYEQGIEPDCKVLEDFSKPIGEVGDTLLDTALYFQKNNTCSTTSL